MFKNNSVKFLLFVFAASLFFACSGNHQKQTQNQEEGFVDPRENTHMQRTKTDTLAVLYNVKKYLDFLKENQTDSAMAMLYEQIGDNEPIALNDSRKDEILKQLKVFPVLDYEILQLNMFSEDDCEVLYNVKYFEKDPDNPMQNTIQCIIKPVRYGYYWYLTIPESVGQPPIE
jgi:hypothetical protein